jgi:hypothetical protein
MAAAGGMLSYEGNRCHFRQRIFPKRIALERLRTLRNGLRSSELQEGTALRLGASRTRPNRVRGVRGGSRGRAIL